MRPYTWRGDYWMDGRSYKNYKMALSHLKVTTTLIYPYLGHLKSTLSSSHFLTVTLFIYLQGFERQWDQGAPAGDIFKSPFHANTVSERSTISLFFSTNDPEVSKYLFWHLRVGGRGVMERVWTVDWLPVVWPHLFQLSIFRSLRSLFQPQSSVSI